ncbi:MAG: sigma 54-interacting transcriptional regulator [Sandaracinaceae bacterium]
MDDDGQETALNRDPLAALVVATRTPAELTWTDARGARRAQIERRASLGSAPGTDVEIADPAVSRVHAELEPRDDGLWIRDVGSTNGSFVNGVRVESARVDPGAVLRVGGTEIAMSRARWPTPIELWPEPWFGPLVGGSVAMRELFATLSRIAVTDSTVLVEGETGTGKELVARAIHESSSRADGPYLVVDCASIAETLLEAELFGHGRGAFTGAVGARNGALLEAHGGTVFLDEIGELPISLQPKLLRFLESKTVRRVGEAQSRAVDVRVIAATHRNLRAMVNDGSFREDLYFRLAVLPVAVPPLRARKEDVPMLVERFAPQREQLFTKEILADITARPWLGNVRELRNFVERAVAFGAEQALSMSDAEIATAGQADDAFPDVSVDEPFKAVRDRWVSVLERRYLEKVLAEHQGNVTAAARASGLDRSYVYRLILKHGL